MSITDITEVTDPPEYNNTLEEIFEKRGKPTVGGLPLDFLERFNNVKFIPVQFYEPDAKSCRTDYYYNCRENVLYKKKGSGFNIFWQAINLV